MTAEPPRLKRPGPPPPPATARAALGRQASMTGGLSMTELTGSQQLSGGAAGKEVAVLAPATVAGAGDGGIARRELPAVKVKSPADLVNLIPWVLRFRPGQGDLVVIGVVPPGRVKLTFRWDLPGSAFQARRAVAALAVAGCTRVFIAGFGSGALVTPAVAQVRQAAEAAGLAVRGGAASRRGVVLVLPVHGCDVLPAGGPAVRPGRQPGGRRVPGCRGTGPAGQPLRPSHVHLPGKRRRSRGDAPGHAASRGARRPADPPGPATWPRAGPQPAGEFRRAGGCRRAARLPGRWHHHQPSRAGLAGPCPG
jgi:hypothetical protein